MPISVAERVAVPTSSSVGHTASMISVVTGRLLRNGFAEVSAQGLADVREELLELGAGEVELLASALDLFRAEVAPEQRPGRVVVDERGTGRS